MKLLKKSLVGECQWIFLLLRLVSFLFLPISWTLDLKNFGMHVFVHIGFWS